jgi:hypothetical protein
MVRKSFIACLVCLPALVGTAHALPLNLLSNGSFESGLTGWSAGGSYSSNPISVILTDGTTGSAYGESILPDNATGGSPDAAGTHGVYFVDDLAHQTLSQSVYLTAGNYAIGFDAYAPLNGFNNRGDASFSGTIADVTLASYNIHDILPSDVQTWINFSGLVTVLSDGFYDVSFAFDTNLQPSADVVVDRVYITASEQGGGTRIGTVPEPATFALFTMGLAGLGATRRRKKD